MDIRELVRSILNGELLAARQWVSDAHRSHLIWTDLERPLGLNEREMSVAAAVLELLASRAGDQPPAWTNTVGALREPLVLDPGLEEMPRSFAHAKKNAPEPFRRRNLLALPDFLDVA